MYTDFCMNISLYFSEINAQEYSSGSFGSYMFRVLLLFLWNCQTLFQSGCTTLHSQQQCMNGPVSPHPRQHLLASLYFIWTILIGVYLHLIVVLIWSSLMVNDVGHVFACLFTICVSSSAEYCFMSFAHILISLFAFLLSHFFIYSR